MADERDKALLLDWIDWSNEHEQRDHNVGRGARIDAFLVARQPQATPPCPNCGWPEPQYTLSWSDRKVDVAVLDLPAIADVVAGCALDHSYDRGDGVPYGLPRDVREALAPVVAQHLSAKRPDWLKHTVEMSEDERERMRDEVLTVLRATVAACEPAGTDERDAAPAACPDCGRTDAHLCAVPATPATGPAATPPLHGLDAEKTSEQNLREIAEEIAAAVPLDRLDAATVDRINDLLVQARYLAPRDNDPPDLAANAAPAPQRFWRVATTTCEMERKTYYITYVCDGGGYTIRRLTPGHAHGRPTRELAEADGRASGLPPWPGTGGAK